MTAVARTFAYTTALDLVSAEMFVEKLQRSLKHPVHYIDGGWRVLVDGLRAAAERSEARIVGDAHVEGVEVSGGRARGVPCERPPSSWQQDPGTPRGWSTGEGTRRCAG